MEDKLLNYLELEINKYNNNKNTKKFQSNIIKNTIKYYKIALAKNFTDDEAI